MAAKLTVKGLSHHYPDEYTGESVHALDDISLEVEDGELVAVVGPSGCGKSTLLNILAGLLPHREGEVKVDGVPVTGPGPDRGVVFQEHAILPWRTVARNIGHGLELRKVPKAERQRRVAEFIDLVGLTGFEDRLWSSRGWELAIGMEIFPSPSLPIRMGYRYGGANKQLLGMGIGLHKGPIQFDLGLAFHNGVWVHTMKGLSLAFSATLVR